MALAFSRGREGQARGGRLGTEFSANQLAKVVTIADASAPVAQVSTVTVGSAQNSTVYNLAVSVPSFSAPVVVSYTSDGTATTSEIAAGLAAAIVANGVTNGLLDSSVSTNVVTLTARAPNVVVTISSTAASSGDLTIATATAAAAGGSYTFGRVVNLSSYNASLDMWSVSAATLPAQATFTMLAVYSASATYSAQPLIRNVHTGAATSAPLSWAAGGSAAAMGGNAETAIEAAISGSSVATSVDGANVTIVVTLPWPTAFDSFVTAPAASGGAGPEDLDLTADTDLGSAPRSGLVMDYGVTPAPSFGVSATATQVSDDVSVLEAGAQVWTADPGATVTAGGAVYVETTAGATNGRCYTTSSSTRYILPDAVWVRGDETLASGDTAALVGLKES